MGIIDIILSKILLFHVFCDGFDSNYLTSPTGFPRDIIGFGGGQRMLLKIQNVKVPQTLSGTFR